MINTFRTLSVAPLLIVVLLLPGCASYYSHFGVFPATNSAGEPREVRVSWRSADYPDWWLASDRATPITIETQCSDRIWRLSDAGGREERSSSNGCGDGIRACGDTALDLDVRSGQPVEPGTVCLAVFPAQSSLVITELGRQVELHVYCRPERTQHEIDGETVNMDYIRASSVPYRVDIRKVRRGSLADRMPDLDDSVCEQD
ncbi:hypothetical protein [Marinobacter xestospongiae]|uniref:hypothetical protein n=1 Tax=Marinobacter xestospongiae TaxID=994319 RepID=UPI0020030BB0|nr:hypothetical protein [Marinobacter xestospongiae]MCK7565812.1 hypothetical protein [Marinobacter xestospongiae]